MEYASGTLISQATRPHWVTWISSAVMYAGCDLLVRHPHAPSVIVFGAVMATAQTAVFSLWTRRAVPQQERSLT